jgi:hypothetical protein
MNSEKQSVASAMTEFTDALAIFTGYMGYFEKTFLEAIESM